ncbi:hypothetical protein BC835DRAFT_61688 [Cytidiella melzeri]|nr:hypothetical protein BC835DRAFT_61688 [Cytidiella melzeri]
MIIIKDCHIFHTPHGCTHNEFKELCHLCYSDGLVDEACVLAFRSPFYDIWDMHRIPEMASCWCGMRAERSLPAERTTELGTTIIRDRNMYVASFIRFR